MAPTLAGETFPWVFWSSLAHVLEERPEVLQVEEEQPLVVGDLEGEREHALLDVVQVEHPGEQDRPHLGHGGPQRVPLLAEDVPEDHRRPRRLQGHTEPLHPLEHLLVGLGGQRHAGEVPLHVGEEDRDADAGEPLGQDAEGDGLSGPGGPGDQAVPVGHHREQRQGLVPLGDGERRCGHARFPSGSWR
jgi:hypothetical protein